MSTHKREQAGLGRSDIDDLVNARHGDPFAVLGPHPDGAGGQWRVESEEGEGKGGQ